MTLPLDISQDTAHVKLPLLVAVDGFKKFDDVIPFMKNIVVVPKGDDNLPELDCLWLGVFNNHTKALVYSPRMMGRVIDRKLDEDKKFLCNILIDDFFNVLNDVSTSFLDKQGDNFIYEMFMGFYKDIANCTGVSKEYVQEQFLQRKTQYDKATLLKSVDQSTPEPAGTARTLKI